MTDTGIRLVKDTVFELARRIFPERDEMEKVDVGRQSLAILMREPEDHPSIHRLNRLVQQAERVTGFQMKIGVGGRAESIGELGRSLRRRGQRWSTVSWIIAERSMILRGSRRNRHSVPLSRQIGKGFV
ncbi:hypothetical protein VQ056_11800 [Paenibacillus sp. JTLBN-2024]